MGRGVGDAVDEILHLGAYAALDPEPAPPVDPATGADWVSPQSTPANSTNLMSQFKGWWLALMVEEGVSIREKLTHFMHTHFTTSTEKADTPEHIYYQNRLMRYYAMRDLKTFVKRFCIDNAILIYLDGRLNGDGVIQENFGRELLELFTVGKGPQTGPGSYTNYTEADVQNAAKVLSGFNTDQTITNKFDPTGAAEVSGVALGIARASDNLIPQTLTGPAVFHDPSTKTFSALIAPPSGTTIAPNATTVGGRATIGAAYQEVDDLIELLFAHPNTPVTICTKMYRYFCYVDITTEIETDIIAPMVTALQANWDLRDPLSLLFKSQHFYDADDAVIENDINGALIKSPLEVTLGAIRFFTTSLGSPTDYATRYNTIYPTILSSIVSQGLDFYQPFDVAGHDAYHQTPLFHRNWITANNLGERYAMADTLLTGGYGVSVDTVAWVQTHVPYTPQGPPVSANVPLADDIVQAFVDYLFPEIIRPERFDYFRDVVLLDNLSIINWGVEWRNADNSGDYTAVRVQLNALVRELMQSPEYQLF